MYYESNVIESILKCSYCDSKFIDVVKLVPDCGSSICGDCYEALKDGLDESSRCFKCQECGDLHELPKNGLADNKLAMRMILQRPQEKALTDKAQKLKSLMTQAEESIVRLQEYNDSDEINSYCDSLELEIMQSVESGIQHLNNLGDDLLSQVNKYREKLLASRSLADDASLVKSGDELSALRTEMNAFKEEWSAYFTQISKAANDEEIERAQERAEKLIETASLLRNEIEKEVFNGRFLEFQKNMLFSLAQDHVGNLVDADLNFNDPILDINEELVLTLQDVNQVAFLANDDVVTCSNKIEVWSHRNGEKLYELDRGSADIFSLAVLRNEWLASGQSDSCIVIWDLKERKESKCLKGHSEGVFTLKALRNGDLASCSWDSTIKIWNPYLESGNLMRTISLLGAVFTCFDLGELPNGYLVAWSARTFSYDDKSEPESDEDDNGKHEDETRYQDYEEYASDDNDDDDYKSESERDNEQEDDDNRSVSGDFDEEKYAIQIWDPISGQLVKKIEKYDELATSFLALSSGKVAIGSSASTVRFVDLTKVKESFKFEISESGQVHSLLELHNGYLACAGYRQRTPGITIWNLKNKKLVKTIELCDTDAMTHLSLSASGKMLASASRDLTTKIWRLDF